MLALFIITLAIIYLFVGLLISRSYYTRKRIEWEKNFANCDRCHMLQFSSPRQHHAMCHDDTDAMYFNSFMLVPFWPLMAPIVGALRGGRSIGSFYMKPVREWETGQRLLIETRDEYRQALKTMKETDPDYKITKDALQGIESQIINIR